MQRAQVIIEDMRRKKNTRIHAHTAVRVNSWCCYSMTHRVLLSLAARADACKGATTTHYNNPSSTTGGTFVVIYTTADVRVVAALVLYLVPQVAQRSRLLSFRSSTFSISSVATTVLLYQVVFNTRVVFGT